MLKRLGWKAGLLIGLVIGLGVGGTFAWAAIPDSTNGKITACYPTSGTSKGVLRVIDYQAGERCAAGQATVSLQQFSPCNGFPRPSVDWRYCNFNHANLNAQNLTSAKLSGANFTSGQFGVTLLNAANLASANLTSANFASANLTSAILTNANLTGASLSGATLAAANVTGAIFSNTALYAAGPSGAKLTGIVGFTSGQLLGVRKRAVNPVYLDPSCSTSLRDLTLVAANNLNLSGFDLSSVYFGETNLAGAALVSANLTCSLLVPAYGLAGANLSGANLTNATVTNGTDLTDANLTSSNLTGAQFGDATGSGANLTGADLTGALLTGVKWLNTTCPDGTNSNSHANTCVGHL